MNEIKGMKKVIMNWHCVELMTPLFVTMGLVDASHRQSATEFQLFLDHMNVYTQHVGYLSYIPLCIGAYSSRIIYMVGLELQLIHIFYNR